MKKLLTAIVVLALVAFLGGTAAADKTSANASAVVILTIEKWCSISFDNNEAFQLTLTSADMDADIWEATSNEKEWEAQANFTGFHVSGSLTEPTNAPGNWSFDLVINPLSGNQYTQTGSATISVTGLSVADGSGTWNDGEFVITVQETVKP